jgi:chemotaxis protein methyltransferase CheR
MTVAETLGANTNARIFASDIDTKVLATAQRGVYPPRPAASARSAEAPFPARHRRQRRAHPRASPELARLIEFRQFNLMSRSGRWANPSTSSSAAT